MMHCYFLMNYVFPPLKGILLLESLQALLGILGICYLSVGDSRHLLSKCCCYCYMMYCLTANWLLVFCLGWSF
uniref:Uncharacterized protein n=1 Tax=Arundo donax TaxID=35708 RepID=A0A0A9FNV0_ARUDO